MCDCFWGGKPTLNIGKASTLPANAAYCSLTPHPNDAIANHSQDA